MFMRLPCMREVGDAVARESEREFIANWEPMSPSVRRPPLHIDARFLLDYFFH